MLIVVSELVTFQVVEGRVSSDRRIGLRLWRDGVIRSEVGGADALPPGELPDRAWARTRDLIAMLSGGAGGAEGDRELAWAEVPL